MVNNDQQQFEWDPIKDQINSQIMDPFFHGSKNL